VTDTRHLDRELAAVAELKRFLENERAGDPQFDDLVLDAIEGQTAFHEVVATLAREARIVTAMAEGIDPLLDSMRARQRRLYKKEEMIRSAIAKAMDAASVPKVTAPDLTITLRAGSSEPKVTDQSQLPEQFLRTKVEVTPDLRAIRDYIADTGRAIPGVVMSNAAPVLTIRGK